MMYGNKLAAAIKVNGKVLREFKDTVYIPFASEYTVLIKNLHTTRAVVNVYIDGENAVPGGLVIDPGREVDLERWIKNGNLSEGNRFKFIERTGNIEKNRGIKLEDGLVRIEYQFEIPRPVLNIPTWTTTTTTWNNNLTGATLSDVSYSTNSVAPQGILRGQVTASGATMNSVNVAQTTSAVSDVGITVPGSKSEQSFKTAYVGMLETAKHNMIIKLLGDLGDNKPVLKPVTVKHKPKCVTCGKQNKAHAKFCQECGTSLEIFA